MLTGLTKGGGGVKEVLSRAEKWGEGGGWGWTPSFLPDIICEQPLSMLAIKSNAGLRSVIKFECKKMSVHDFFL